MTEFFASELLLVNLLTSVQKHQYKMETTKDSMVTMYSILILSLALLQITLMHFLDAYSKNASSVA